MSGELESAASRIPRIGISELHLHLEGSVSIPTTLELAAQRSHPWASFTPRQLRDQYRYSSLESFLGVIRNVCAIICSTEGLERIARELSHTLAGQGVRYAEVYVSPYIYVRWGLDYHEVLEAVDRGFAQGEEAGGASCRILLDSVRQWGPDAAKIVLETYAERKLERVVGFGLGGEELVPLEEFVDLFNYARDLGLHTVVHAGESKGAEDVKKAVDLLRVERVAHGIRSLEIPGLTRELAASGVVLDLAVSSNYRTAAVSTRLHPIRALLDHGVTVTLSTDDPALFRTDLPREYQRARRFGKLSAPELRQIAMNGVDYSFADSVTKAELKKTLTERFQSLEKR